MITLYHISDLHIIDPAGHEGANAKAESLIKTVAEDVTKTQGKRLIVITGDIVDAGHPAQYSEATRILDMLPRGDDVTILITPGNHDIGGIRGTLFHRSCVEDFDRLAKHLGMGANFVSKFDDEGPGFVPYVARLDDKTCTLTAIVLNSASQLQLQDLSRGNLGATQVMRLAGQLATQQGENETRIICLHHKPLTHSAWGPAMRLDKDDQRALRELTHANRITAYLYGHQEDGGFAFQAEMKDDGFKTYLFNANSSVKKQCYFRCTVGPGGAFASVETCAPQKKANGVPA